MNKNKRKIIFIGVIFLFLLITPLVLLYAAGYSFDWQKKEPVLTGAFYIKSTPKKSKIYINQQIQKEKTPAFLDQLPAQKNHLKVTHTNYHTWQKNLKIKPQLVTEVKNIFLPLLEPKLSLIKKDLKKNFSLNDYLSQNKNDAKQNIFYIKQKNNLLYKTDSQKSFNEQLTVKPLSVNQNYKIFSSPNEENIAILGEKNKKLYLFRKERKNFKVLAKNVKKAQFSQDNQKLLFFNDSEIWVYYLTNINSQPKKKKGSKEIITRLSCKINNAIWYPQTNYHIIFSTEENVKFTELDNRDHRNTFTLFDFKINQIKYDSEEEKIYFTKDNKLFSTQLTQ